MKHSMTFLAGIAVALGSAGAQTRLASPDARITDVVVRADQAGYEALQARIKALNDAGRPLRDRHLAQAQCWLDTSFHEYTRNDRGPWPQAALGEAERLVHAMESASTPLPDDTPLVAGAQRIRPDLWQRAAALRQHAGWSCAQAKAACGEVELVHAGHEQVQLGWRHAKPYVQIAEDLVGEAEAQAARCVPPAAPLAPAVVEARVSPLAVAPGAAEKATPVSAAVAPAPVIARDPREVLLFAQVVFRFDRDALDDVPDGGLVSVQALLERLRAERLELQSVQLSGHADRLNASGRADYNLTLSERRVAAVRAYLVGQGIAADRIGVEAKGDRQPRATCVPQAAAALQECLLPDRRVEILVITRRP
jgi:OmpA-OmpF porin, OOP family